MADESQAADQLERDLKLAFDAMLSRHVFQTELQDWLDGPRDGDYRLMIAARFAQTAMKEFTKPH